MGKLEAFGILFTGDRSVYNSGEYITGEVIVELNDSMKMTGIHLVIHGVAIVNWVEGYDRESHDRRKTQSYHHRSMETYIEEKITLFGKGENDHRDNDNPVLPAGIHSFPFEYRIPDKPLPCSYEGKFGFVRYYMKATIHKPWKFDHTTKRAFSILGEPYDINLDEDALYPVSRVSSKSLCCLCFRTGPITVEVQTDRTSYCAGENILISAEINNMSNRKMEMTTATLRQSVTFRAKLKSRTPTEEIIMIRGEAIPPRSSDKWDNEILEIPALPPSQLRHCRIIDISYDVEFTVFISGMHYKNITMHLPIKIGNVQLRTALQQQPVCAVATPIDIKEPEGEQIADTRRVDEVQPILQEQSYADCHKGARSIKDENDSDYVMGNLNFTPVYLVYKFIKNTKDAVERRRSSELNRHRGSHGDGSGAAVAAASADSNESASNMNVTSGEIQTNV